MNSQLDQKKYVDVVIIDSGYSSYGSANAVVDGINITEKQLSNDITDYQGHGTCIANIILQDNPQCSLFCIKITDLEGDSISPQKIIEALYYVRDNVKCKIINISVGTQVIDDYEKWNQIINSLLDNGSVIVSAFDNQGAVSYPAAFDNVIGVDETQEVSSDQQIISLHGHTLVNVILSKKYYRVKNHTGKIVLANGSSMACAHVAGILSKKISGTEVTWEETISCLRSIADYDLTCPFPKQSSAKCIANSIQKAVVFPFNKEMHSIAAFSDLLSFEVSAYYDFPIGRSINKKIADIIPYSQNNNVVKSIANLDWDSDFDTLICGHCREYERITKKPFLKDIIQNCIEKGKKAYCFDDISEELALLNQGSVNTIQFPSVSQDCVPTYRFGKLRQLSKPVLGVFGTSSVQGKFTLQLMIRREMIKRGYHIGQVATEPSGYLFGMDLVYPMGYGSTARIGGAEAITFLNEEMWKIESGKNPDIIIIGSQSGTVPYSFLNVNQLHFDQYELIQGTLPDAVILCVNLFDEMDYIERTIHFIESIHRTKVIAICVSPLLEPANRFMRDTNRAVSNDDILSAFAVKAQSRFSIPAFISSIHQIKEIVNIVESFFG